MFKRMFLVAVLLSFTLPLFADELKPVNHRLSWIVAKN